MSAAVTSPIPGAQRTELAAGVLGTDGLRSFTRLEFKALGISWEAFFAEARLHAAADLAGVKPRYVRNRQKVIEYAEVTSTRPVIASAVLAPEFRALFKDTLGPKLLVVVPNRFTAYVFAPLASNYQDYWPMVFEAYRATVFPVSVELFELSTGGLKAVGVYEAP